MGRGRRCWITGGWCGDVGGKRGRGWERKVLSSSRLPNHGRRIWSEIYRGDACGVCVRVEPARALPKGAAAILLSHPPERGTARDNKCGAGL